MTLPETRNYEYAYQQAYQLGREQISRIGDIAERCHRAGAKYQANDKAIIVRYLNEAYRVSLPEVEISCVGKKDLVPIKDRILIVHYLARARGTPLSGKLITYKELPEGTVYFPTFYARAIKPLVNQFGKEPARLLTAAHALGGRKADYGDAAVTVDAFPRVPITLVLWRGDDEFPPEGNILFDSTIPDYLAVEDINVLCETIAWRLVRLAKAGGE